MKVLQINTVCGNGSVGKITVDLAKTLQDGGHSCRILYGRRQAPKDVDAIKIGSIPSMLLHVLATFFKGEHGFSSKKITEQILKEIDAYEPDVIQLHNIHGFYLNVEQLFSYLKEKKIPVVWTLHDAWALTGHCAYFDYVSCSKWKTGCEKCPQNRTAYPYALFKDNSKKNYARKKEAFTKVENLTIVTPSKWLAEHVKASYLSEYPVEVIANGIDLDVFHPQQGRLIRKYNLQDKKILLGVANVWEKRKGLEFFIELAKRLPQKYQIVLIGIDDRTKKKLPENILALSRTKNTEELAQWYSVADLYINPTLEDNFPTTNLEALACGTGVVTFNTGGSPESIDNSCGKVVQEKNADALEQAILQLEEYPILKESCLLKAMKYDKKERFLEYKRLYEAKIRRE